MGGAARATIGTTPTGQGKYLFPHRDPPQSRAVTRTSRNQAAVTLQPGGETRRATIATGPPRSTCPKQTGPLAGLGFNQARRSTPGRIPPRMMNGPLLVLVLVQEYPHVSGRHARLSEAYTGLGKQGEAKASRDQAKRVSRENTLLALKEGTKASARDYAHHDAGFHAKAYELQSRLMALDPKSWVRANNHAYTLATREYALDHALELARHAVALRPDDGGILDTLGWVYVKMDRNQKAVETFERVVKLKPDNALLQYHLGGALVQAGEKERAGDALKAALKLKPSKRLEKQIREKIAEAGETSTTAAK